MTSLCGCSAGRLGNYNKLSQSSQYKSTPVDDTGNGTSITTEMMPERWTLQKTNRDLSSKFIEPDGSISLDKAIEKIRRSDINWPSVFFIKLGCNYTKITLAEKKYETVRISFPSSEKWGFEIEDQAIKCVQPDSYAKKMKVKEGWVILKVNGRRMPQDDSIILSTILNTKRKLKTTNILFEKRPYLPMTKLFKFPSSRERWGFDIENQIVINVRAGSCADRQGLRNGWKLEKVNGVRMPENDSVIICTMLNSKNKGKTTSILFEQRKILRVTHKTGMAIRIKPEYPGIAGPEVIKYGAVLLYSQVTHFKWRKGKIKFYKLADGRGWIHNYNPIDPSAFDSVEELEHRTKLILLDAGYIGISFQGNAIKKVAPKSQAGDTGIQIGWIILEVNGVRQCNDDIAIIRAIKKTNDVGKPTAILFHIDGTDNSKRSLQNYKKISARKQRKKKKVAKPKEKKLTVKKIKETKTKEKKSQEEKSEEKKTKEEKKTRLQRHSAVETISGRFKAQMDMDDPTDYELKDAKIWICFGKSIRQKMNSFLHNVAVQMTVIILIVVDASLTSYSMIAEKDGIFGPFSIIVLSILFIEVLLQFIYRDILFFKDWLCIVDAIIIIICFIFEILGDYFKDIAAFLLLLRLGRIVRVLLHICRLGKVKTKKGAVSTVFDRETLSQ